MTRRPPPGAVFSGPRARVLRSLSVLTTAQLVWSIVAPLAIAAVLGVLWVVAAARVRAGAWLGGLPAALGVAGAGIAAHAGLMRLPDGQFGWVEDWVFVLIVAAGVLAWADGAWRGGARVSAGKFIARVVIGAAAAALIGRRMVELETWTRGAWLGWSAVLGVCGAVLWTSLLVAAGGTGRRDPAERAGAVPARPSGVLGAAGAAGLSAPVTMFVGKSIDYGLVCGAIALAATVLAAAAWAAGRFRGAEGAGSAAPAGARAVAAFVGMALPVIWAFGWMWSALPLWCLLTLLLGPTLVLLAEIGPVTAERPRLKGLLRVTLATAVTLALAAWGSATYFREPPSGYESESY
ncbi:MAG: hypothetical protein IBJ11_02705 [Phycisphaerales bacterium]|nr:hypothetical protein [Phycisphaerales bacterium]